MADIVDEANDRTQALLDRALSKVPKPGRTPTGIGLCLNCGEAVNDDRRWCDAGCRDEWQHTEDRRNA